MTGGPRGVVRNQRSSQGEAFRLRERSLLSVCQREGSTVRVEVWLYGELKKYGGRAAKVGHARLDMELPAGALVRDLLAQLGLPLKEKGITFVNGILTDMPGLQADLDRPLSDGDRVGLLSRVSMWPCQYRSGAKTSPELEAAVRERGASLQHAFTADGRSPRAE